MLIMELCNNCDNNYISLKKELHRIVQLLIVCIYTKKTFIQIQRGTRPCSMTSESSDLFCHESQNVPPIFQTSSE